MQRNYSGHQEILAPQRVYSNSSQLIAPTKSTIAGVIFSPSSALAISLIGYYPLASYTNFFFPEGSLGGIIIRLMMLSSLGLIFFFTTKIRGVALTHLFIPAIIFMVLYILRLLENFYIQNIDIIPGAQTIFSVFIFNALLPCIILSYFKSNLRDSDFAFAMSALAAIFLLGLTLNLDELAKTASSRLTLDRVNPIVLANTSIAFLQFQLLFFRQSNFIKIATLVTTPFLLLVAILAQSRGPWLAAAGTLAFYIFVSQGRARLFAIGAASLGVLLAFIYGSDYLAVIFNRFMFTDLNLDDSTFVHYQGITGAWKQFTDDIFFGRYAIEMVTGFYPHNIFLEAPMSVGLLGAIPFFIHLGFATLASIGIVRSRDSSLVAKFLALTFVRESIVNSFAGSIWGATSFWISSFMVIALWYGRRRNSPNQR